MDEGHTKDDDIIELRDTDPATDENSRLEGPGYIDTDTDTVAGGSDRQSGPDRIVRATDILPENLLVVPVHGRPLFPGMVVPLQVAGRFITTVQFADGENKLLALVLVREETTEDHRESDFFRWGTVGRIMGIHRNPDGTLQVLFRTLKRCQIDRFLRFDPHIVVRVGYPESAPPGDSQESKALQRSLVLEMQQIIRENPMISNEMKNSLQSFDFSDPGLMTDIAASLTSSSSEELQQVLETIDILVRMRFVLFLLKKEADLIRLQKQISDEIQEKINKQQREFFLREQLRVIKKELGLEVDDKTLEVQRIEERLRGLTFPESVRKRLDEEMEKMKLIEPTSPEFTVMRSYLDLVTSLPWGIYSRDTTDIGKSRRILNHDHYGLDDIKDRIIEFLATMKLRKEVKGSIICLVGPPGVGKTSVGRSIARALNRQFYRFSLGGMRDEAEIKGHRRTYIGAMPGKIINGLRYCGTANPVIMLDEIDKLSHSFLGDPSSALLEVLDPEQNREFVDHYLDVPFDLSRVLFIMTANTLDTIPSPLLDRMEVMRLSGYVEQEKVEIARRYLVPRQLEQHGLTRDNLEINRNSLAKIAQEYAREAGVRNLEKNIARICRKVATAVATGETKKTRITIRNLEKYLGKPWFSDSPLDKKVIPGVSTGLAWTSMGGAVLRIETASVGRKKGFTQTGQLGEVMAESATIAYSYVNSRIETYGGSAEFFEKNFVHIHVPEGATKKDGPSAGITMAAALVSLALGRALPRDLAMTGELTLTGNVLPVGGIREKVIAAKRMKIQNIILPRQNRRDYEELKDYVKKGITFQFVDHFDDVFRIVFQT